MEFMRYFYSLFSTVTSTAIKAQWMCFEAHKILTAWNVEVNNAIQKWHELRIVGSARVALRIHWWPIKFYGDSIYCPFVCGCKSIGSTAQHNDIWLNDDFYDVLIAPDKHKNISHQISTRRIFDSVCVRQFAFDIRLSVTCSFRSLWLRIIYDQNRLNGCQKNSQRAFDSFGLAIRNLAN